MTNEDRNRADARFNKSNKPKADKYEQDANAKAVLAHKARLEALRRPREATDPQGFQPGHVVEHGLGVGVLLELVGFGLVRFVEARIGAVAVFICHLSRLLSCLFGCLFLAVSY